MTTTAASPAPAERTSLRTWAWHAVCVVIGLVLLYPVLWLLTASFKSGEEVISNLSPIPKVFTPGNYTEAVDGVSGLTLWRLFGNSLLVSVGTVVGNVLSCSLAAYAFARLRFRGRGLYFALMIGTLMLPAHLMLIPQYVIFQELGMVGTYLPLILPKFLATEAFFVFLVVQFIRSLPAELDQAAAIDGCGPYRTFWHVIMPLLKPAIVTTTIFSFIWSWNDFFSQVIYLVEPETYTLQLGLRMFVDMDGSAMFGPMFAMSVLTLVPVLLFFLAFQRLLVEGVQTTGLKG
ncbi:MULTISPECIES: carbohydrate ABC transporter permease [Streptomyces]|uniref:carbohydrate ABC transporter permease n=1 Tax=Streptomyces TaxID=1883 RepID=UPI002035F034|nr:MULTISPECIES: carbohydrate ABC transporter permease [Streptomyces]UUA10374.1 carbohydrate ABC transporter permease [Streptomyces koelreuteriae]UUA17981.1 carbohydrate ABC transporter permease [Streptomyces sp. CRCS-T-1]